MSATARSPAVSTMALSAAAAAVSDCVAAGASASTPLSDEPLGRKNPDGFARAAPSPPIHLDSFPNLPPSPEAEENPASREISQSELRKFSLAMCRKHYSKTAADS